MPHLFDPWTIRDVTFRNRIVVSPMCQYSAEDGVPNDWHFVHLGTRAVGGAALVFTEATAVSPEGRITPQDLGLWNDAQAEQFARVIHFVRSQGSHAGIQLAHAGRKGSTRRPWEGEGAVPPASGGWTPVAPSAIAFGAHYPHPAALDESGIAAVVSAFAAAASRARDAGCSVVEIHAAHGYLLHEFLSPLANRRTDRYGGSFSNRVRVVLEIASAVRRVWPETLPLFVRISATDWLEGGWDLEQSVELARLLLSAGVDVVDCSSGGLDPSAVAPVGPGYQARFAEEVRRRAGIATGAVGMITSPSQADHIVRSGQADCVFLARELLRDPYWPLRAARELGHATPWPAQYLRAATAGSKPSSSLA